LRGEKIGGATTGGKDNRCGIEAKGWEGKVGREAGQGEKIKGIPRGNTTGGTSGAIEKSLVADYSKGRAKEDRKKMMMSEHRRANIKTAGSEDLSQSGPISAVN